MHVQFHWKMFLSKSSIKLGGIGFGPILYKNEFYPSWGTVQTYGNNVKPTLVENMVKKNRNRFPIAVLLTALICNR